MEDILSSLSPEKRAAVLKALKDKALLEKSSTVRPRGDRMRPVPLSPSQQSLWLLEQLQGASGSYNELAAFRVEGQIDLDALERALLEVVARHEILRSRFPVIDGEAVQEITSEVVSNLRTADLAALEPQDQAVEVARYVELERGKPFDLALGNLWRTTLLRLGEGHSVLLIAAHHIVLDGWSIAVFREELAALYTAFLANRASPLPPLPVQYADYALWQLQDVQRKRHHADLTYWKEQLRDLPPLLEMPVCRPRPETPSYRGARHYIALGAELSERLKRFARGEDATLFMALLAGFQILLQRYSGQDDIAIGSAVANRNIPEVERLIGYFINTVVLRGRLSDDPTVRDFLRRTGATAVAAYEHQEVPFQTVVDALKPERSPSFHPLFQVAFNLQNTPRADETASALRLTPERVTNVAAKFDLILWLEETAAGLSGYWEYSVDLFDVPLLARMTEHLATVLEAMVQRPDARISELPLLGAEELALLASWAQPLKQEVPVMLAHQLVESQASSTPDAIALVYEQERLPYRLLNRRANAVARTLRERGVEPGARVAIYVERSVEMVVAMLGVLKAGATYIPLDPAYPDARLAEMLQDARPAAVLTRARWQARLAGQSVVVVDNLVTSERDDTNADIAVGPDATAYVIYTSGSAGVPKGVLISHRSLVASTVARWHAYADAPRSFLLLSSSAFDSSVAGIYWTLSRGGALVIPNEERLLDPTYLRGLVAQHGVTHLLGIPALYSELLHGELSTAELSSLRVAIVAGETCPPALVSRHHRLLSNAALYNEYGPTESTVWTTMHRCTAQDSEGSVPIGRPVSHVQVHVLDGHAKPVPVGVPGELYVAGSGVAQGYLNRPELSQTHFVEVTDCDGRVQRMYRTGDIARWTEKGELKLGGRVDQQIKVRGHRLELGEVEAVLCRHPQVLEAAAFVQAHEDGTAQLRASVVMEGASIEPQVLRQWLENWLPAYAVPAVIVVLDRLPRLPNGKVDRSQLLASLAGVEAADPRGDTGLETSIMQIWKEVLKLETVGSDDDFFKIGGDSLSMIRVYNRLRELIDVKVPIVDLFKHPTPRLAARLLSPEPPSPRDEWSALERSIADIWRDVLKRDEIGRNDDFFKIGGDSLAMIRVYNKLREIVDTNVPIIDLFKNSTPAALAKLLDANMVSGVI